LSPSFISWLFSCILLSNLVSDEVGSVKTIVSIQLAVTSDQTVAHPLYMLPKILWECHFGSITCVLPSCVNNLCPTLFCLCLPMACDNVLGFVNCIHGESGLLKLRWWIVWALVLSRLGGNTLVLCNCTHVSVGIGWFSRGTMFGSGFGNFCQLPVEYEASVWFL
jgi:hypothetical protein